MINEEKLYNAIQRIKLLPATEIFKIYNQINNKDECSEYAAYTLEEKRLLYGYIELMKEFNHELMEIIKKEQAKKCEALCISLEATLCKKLDNKGNEGNQQSDNSNNRIKSFFTKVTKIFR